MIKFSNLSHVRAFINLFRLILRQSRTSKALKPPAQLVEIHSQNKDRIFRRGHINNQDYLNSTTRFNDGVTRGFVGFGVTDDGRRADLIIGGTRDDETPYFADRYSATANGSKIDARQDWTMHEVVETSDSTLLWFIRNLNTGDTAEDIAIIDKETNILWIIGETDDIEGPIIGGVNAADLTPYFTDRKGTQSGSTRSINVDPSQDYGLLSAREANGVTRLRFIRDFDTGDVNDYIIKYENAHFIWALGTNDGLSAHSGSANRGAFAVNPLVASNHI
ncbi:unnamed protein product [Allacma fusca]|uniref:DOMON domain-containing protein n=1 Tax=Allacma fusca TaxID=39272 RepID=A0A8J2NUF9_9HEXA|nr:unnamed protein product [Allacma fusca]